MSQIPDDYKYMTSHEWLRVESDGTAFVGISDHAQEQLGDLVFIECPDVGANLNAGDEAGVVESVKAASDIYSPVSGEVIAVNEKLEGAPESVNEEPYGDGWIFQIKVSDAAEVEDLMTAEQYQAQIDAEE